MPDCLRHITRSLGVVSGRGCVSGEGDVRMVAGHGWFVCEVRVCVLRICFRDVYGWFARVVGEKVLWRVCVEVSGACWCESRTP